MSQTDPKNQHDDGRAGGEQVDAAPSDPAFLADGTEAVEVQETVVEDEVLVNADGERQETIRSLSVESIPDGSGNDSTSKDKRPDDDQRSDAG